MALRDYHLILGVSRTETARGIQNTFRELVKQLHPDRVGPQGTAAFQDLVEAYQVLSDPERRKAYRHQLHQTETAAQRKRGSTDSPAEDTKRVCWVYPSMDLQVE